MLSPVNFDSSSASWCASQFLMFRPTALQPFYHKLGAILCVSRMGNREFDKRHRARDLVVRGMRRGGHLLLQTLAEFSSVAIRKARIAVDEVRTAIDAWRSGAACARHRG